MPQALSPPRIECYIGGRLLRDHRLVQEDLWVVNGKIAPPQKRVDKEHSMRGKIIAPGYIDLQINGAFGIDFATSLAPLDDLVKKLNTQGVLNFLPTLISSPANHYRSWKSHYLNHPAVLGVHYEGPFLNPEKAGAHSRKILLPITEEAVFEILDNVEGVKIVTVAPEIPNSLGLITKLSSKGIVVAAGHSLASYEEATAAFKAGIKLVTHLFNAMTPIQHRHPGLAIAALNHPTAYYSLIADGVHVHPAMVKLAWEHKPGKAILITDAMAAMGLDEGLFRLGHQTVEVKGKEAHIAGSKKLAGSALQMDQAVRNFKEMTGCSTVQALEAATLHPAELLGITHRKGTLTLGADADLIFLDEELNVQGYSSHYK